VSYTIFRYEELEFRPPSRGNQNRGLAPLSEALQNMRANDPPERVELPQGSVAAVESETALQLRNESGAEITVLIVGAPPVQGKADYLPDVE